MTSVIDATQTRAQRRLGYLVPVAGILAAGAAFVLLPGAGGGETTERGDSAAAPPPAQRLALARTPYIGVSCARANDIGCDRVGLAVWLRRPATSLRATISGRRVGMALPCAYARFGRPCRTYCREPGVLRDQPCGTYFEGFLQPAGLLVGPLKVTHRDGPFRWTGEDPPAGVVHLRARFRDGAPAERTILVPLAAGWG